ncbi:semaphorin-3F-like [Ornithorhynchus anatinus]|uniref:semaphorin-3F-like n=1 Tax=Ornithorhynchus anatinus TaxID=9258 RepID=UPI0010A7AB8C|nr:semaphorin-3F-like [Ornithorhynchus anatinus]
MELMKDRLWLVSSQIGGWVRVKALRGWYPVAPAKARRASVLLLLLAQGSLLGEASSLHFSRLSLTFKELLKTHAAKEFIFNFETRDFRLLHMDHDRIYLGLRDYLVSFGQSKMNEDPLIIKWPASPEQEKTCQRKMKRGQENLCFNFLRIIQPPNRTHLLVCGTGAFSPICAIANRGRHIQDYVFHMVHNSQTSGLGSCSYTPNSETMATFIDGNLYTGMHMNFLGSDPAIFRSAGRLPTLRSDPYNNLWLNAPAFLKAFKISDSINCNDDKLYFLFRENTIQSFPEPTTLPLVGHVCLNDVGGQYLLMNKWTTFLKARLMCSVTEDGKEILFNKLQDVFIHPIHDKRDPLIYGIFTTPPSDPFQGSAICVYSMADIRAAFNGSFTDKISSINTEKPDEGDVPTPRPGSCPGGVSAPDFHSSKAFPSKMIEFIRTHPLMFNPVYPLQRRPLSVRIGPNSTFTTGVMDVSDTVEGSYKVFPLGTAHGTVQKVAVLERNGTSEAVNLEEVEVFRTPAPVKTMMISSKWKDLFVSSDTGVSQLKLYRCPPYKACALCCRVRDPYCNRPWKSCSPKVKRGLSPPTPYWAGNNPQARLPLCNIGCEHKAGTVLTYLTRRAPLRVVSADDPGPVPAGSQPEHLDLAEEYACHHLTARPYGLASPAFT